MSSRIATGPSTRRNVPQSVNGGRMTFRLRHLAVAIVVVGVASSSGLVPARALINPADPPRISIGGGGVVEGHLTRRHIRFTITLSWPAPAPVTVNYVTGVVGDAAESPTDYKAKSG